VSDPASFFDDAAAGYDRAFEDPGPGGHALRTRQAAVLRLLGDEPPGSAVDAGMGPGRLVSALADRGWTVSGVDLSPGMVDAARARVSLAADRLLVGSIEELPFADAVFDLALATGVVEYVDARRAVAELVRVTKPGGRIIASIPNPRAPYGLWRRHVVHRATRALGRGETGLAHQREPLTPAGFAALLREAGLVLDGAERVNAQLAFSPLDAVAPRAATALARRLEHRGGRMARVAATQVVLAARTPPAPEALVFPVRLDAAPTVELGGRTWHRRPEFHVTTFTPETLAAASGVPATALAAAGAALRPELTTPRPFRFDGRVACARDDGGRETLVAFCDVEGLDEVYERLSSRAGAAIPPPPTHVTLYTAEPGMQGIGLATAAEVRDKTEPLAAQDAVAVLSGVRSPG